MQLTGHSLETSVVRGRRSVRGAPCRPINGVNRQLVVAPTAALPSNKTQAAQGMMKMASMAVQRPGQSNRKRSVAVNAFFGKLFKTDPSEGTRKKYQARVDQINAMEPQMQALSDEQLRSKTTELKARVANGESLDAILPEAFAVSYLYTSWFRFNSAVRVV